MGARTDPQEPARASTACPGHGWPSLWEWCYLVVGGYLVWRYFFFYDDAFVYFRYVDNLLFLGIGLVYNAGEFVEGFSSPLWALLLVSLRSTALPYPLLLSAVALLGYALFWWLAVLVNRRLAPSDGPRIDLPLAYLCTSYGFLCYFSGGLETILLHLAAALVALEATSYRSRFLDAGLALMPLARHELVLPWLVVAGVRWYRTGRPPWALGLMTAVSLGGYLVFRVVYYADFLPATFYLKDGSDWDQGVAYLQDTFGTYGTWWLLGAGLGLALLAGRGAARWGARGVMVAAALPVLLYVVRIGGAPIHYRYLAFPFALLVLALAGLPESALVRRWAGCPRWVGAVGLLVAGLSGTLHPRQLPVHPLEVPRRPGAEVADRTVNKINDAAHHRQRIHALGGGSWRSAANEDLMRRYALATRPFRYRDFMATGWCHTGYRNFDEHVVSSYGLTDGILARCRVRAERPGHKSGLEPLAEDLVEIRRRDPEGTIGRYRRAVEENPRRFGWMRRALDSIELIERKVHNDHGLMANLRLALTRIEPIVPRATAAETRTRNRDLQFGGGARSRSKGKSRR